MFVYFIKFYVSSGITAVSTLTVDVMCALRSIFYVPGLVTRRVQNTGVL
jgi:hypothetical protein